MAQEFEGDLTGAVFWGAEMSGARFRDVNLTDVTISHAWLLNVDVDAWIDNLVINGVDVTDFVNQRDPWYPLRAMLRPADPEGMRATWVALEQEWATTIGVAAELPESALHESVGGEWSFVQTLRHLVFAIDKWFTAPVLGEPFHPMGLPNSGSTDVGWPGIDAKLEPSVADALGAWGDRTTRVRQFLGSVSADDFDRPVDVLENGPTRWWSACTRPSRSRSGTTALRAATSKHDALRGDVDAPMSEATRMRSVGSPVVVTRRER